MTFLPLERMLTRVEADRADSDIALFSALMYLGEMTAKLTVSGLVAAIEDDRDRSRYAVLHKLVRADGIGSWAETIDEMLQGPTSQHLLTAARMEQRELTERSGAGTWQYEAISMMNQ